MVHPKKKSGDPDYDDKVPMEDHVGRTVTGPDGRDVTITEAVGPLNADGTHANLEEVPEQDTRPEEGGVAEEKAEVQRVEPVKATGSEKQAGTSKSADKGGKGR